MSKNYEVNLGRWMDGRMGGWMGGWMEAKAGLRIAYSNQKYFTEYDLALQFA